MSDAPTRFSPTAAAAEVAQYGSTVLRQAWCPDLLAALRGAIVRYVEQRSARIAGSSIAPHERMYHTHGAGVFESLVSAGLIGPSILTEMFSRSDFQALCSRYFEDDRLYVCPSRLAFRVHDPSASDRSFVPYHQDSGTQDPRVSTVLNCWIPLDPGAGREAPGLEVVRAPCEPNFPLKDFGLHSENAAYDFITIDRERIIAAYGEHLLAPEFEVGDGLAFSQYVIHRTYVTPDMTQPRINFEFRVFSSKSLAPGATANEVLQTAVRVA